MAELITRPLYKKSLDLFVQLVGLLEHAALASLVSEDRDTSAIGPAIRNECGRFRVWAENVGANRADRLSLDYRLREATRAKQLVVELLDDLITALQDAGNIISGDSHEPNTSDAESWSLDIAGPAETGLPPSTPFEECLAEISHIITCLYKFSIATRNPTTPPSGPRSKRWSGFKRSKKRILRKISNKNSRIWVAARKVISGSRKLVDIGVKV